MAIGIDVKKFLSHVSKNDLARQNLYAVRFASLQDTAKQIMNTGESFLNSDIDVIKGIGVKDALASTAALFGTGFELERNIGMMVKSVNLPGSSYETDVDKTRRRPHHVVKAKTDETVTMSLYLSPSHPERKMLMGWFKQIYSNDSAQVGFFANYARTIEIYTYDRNSNMATMTSLKNAFPIRVGGVQLGYENNNAVAEFEVEFVYESATYMSEDLSNTIADSLNITQNFEKTYNSIYNTASETFSNLF
ncbi:baseplate tail tube initiator [Vibrio phage nt-1]|uniref:Baseplate tail tube initiator n=1 Tax=Vibrio phage nt-1 TaxID=115992 RepID=R9TJ28_9CAUD|nr:tail tube [Vibrio phage nt-1]AGN30380.1 baseplate tail tube initiator [Vibrio phage nt-1]